MRLLAILSGALICASGAATEASPTPSVPSTLDHAIMVSSSVDRSEVYLGEPIQLTLEYWELKIRGLKAQPLYRGGGLTLPPLEGFYAGTLQSGTEEVERDGAHYTVTRHRQRLYPAIAGELEIGPWRWQGTVRGYVASGPQSKTVDLSTQPIAVHVRPLPPPPASFRGAVGEYEVHLTASTTAMSQGEPASLLLEVHGTGNPATFDAPALPEAAWYQLGSVSVEGEVETDVNTGKFTKRFRIGLMPLKPGDFTIPAVSFTCFSPTARRYTVVESAACAVQVASSGPVEPLVVIRGEAKPGVVGDMMENGKLALAPSPSRFVFRHANPGVWSGLIAIPPLIGLILFLWIGGWRNLTPVRSTEGGEREWADRLAGLERDPEPFDALRGLVRGAVTSYLDGPVDGMSDRELVVFLTGMIEADVLAPIAAVLQACDVYRFGKRPETGETIAELTHGLPEALASLGRRSRRGRNAR